MTKSPKGWFVGQDPEEGGHGEVGSSSTSRDATPPARWSCVNGEEGSPNLLLLMEEEAYRESKKQKNEDRARTSENPLDEPRGRSRRARSATTIRTWRASTFATASASGGSASAPAAASATPRATASRPSTPRADPGFHSLADSFQAGGAWAGLGHLAPEVGFMLTPNVAFSLEGRFQYIPQNPKYARFAARGAISGLAKLIVYTKQSQIRFFGSGHRRGRRGLPLRRQAGIDRHRPGPPLYAVRDFQDTVKGGPVDRRRGHRHVLRGDQADLDRASRSTGSPASRRSRSWSTRTWRYRSTSTVQRSRLDAGPVRPQGGGRGAEVGRGRARPRSARGPRRIAGRLARRRA